MIFTDFHISTVSPHTYPVLMGPHGETRKDTPPHAAHAARYVTPLEGYGLEARRKLMKTLANEQNTFNVNEDYENH